MQSKTKKIVLAALLASLTCVATMIIKVPLSSTGYINLGDCVVLLCGWLLSPLYGFLAAGIGSALADILSGYIAYAPATLLIKGLMALIAYLFTRKSHKLPLLAISGFTAEAFMVGGYLLFESCLYGFLTSVVNVPFNSIQGAAGLILGILLVRIFDKSNIVN